MHARSCEEQETRSSRSRWSESGERICRVGAQVIGCCCQFTAPLLSDPVFNVTVGKCNIRGLRRVRWSFPDHGKPSSKLPECEGLSLEFSSAKQIIFEDQLKPYIKDRLGSTAKQRRGRGRGRRGAGRRRASVLKETWAGKRGKGCRHRQRAGTRRCNLIQRRKRKRGAGKKKSKQCSKEETAKPDPVEETKKIYDEWRAEEQAQYEASQAMLPDKFDIQRTTPISLARCLLAEQKGMMKNIFNHLADITSAVSSLLSCNVLHDSLGVNYNVLDYKDWKHLLTQIRMVQGQTCSMMMMVMMVLMMVMLMVCYNYDAEKYLSRFRSYGNKKLCLN